MATKRKPAKRKYTRLSVEQIELVGQFNDSAFENKTLGFDAVAKMIIGPRPFPNTPNGRKFKAA